VLAALLLSWLPSPIPGDSAAPARDGLEQALEGLGSDSAEQRWLAERWLATHLERPDFARVARVAVGASAEVRARLSSALAVDKNLSLAALFATDSEAGLRALGEEAVARSLARWYGTDPPTQAARNELGAFLAAFPPTHVLPPSTERAAVVLERIARVVDARQEERPESDAVALVVGPELWGDTGTPSPADEPLQPGFGGLVAAVAGRHGVRLRGFGLAGRRPVVLVERGAGTERGLFASAVEWVRAVEGSGPLAAGSARALAALRWPAAMCWLEERWAAGDGAALEGLVLAAGQERVAPWLFQPDTVRALARRLVDPGTPEYQRDELLRALIALGGTGAGGVDLSPALLTEWAQQGGLASIACARVHAAWSRAPEELRSTWRGWLEASPADARERGRGERLAALHALAATGGRVPLTLGDGAGLLVEAREEGVVDAALAWMASLGAALPPEWLAPDAPLDVRCALLEHWLARDEPERAVSLLGELARSDVDTLRLAQVLARQRARQGALGLRRVVLGADLTDAVRARLLLLAGAPLPGSAPGLFASLEAAPALSPIDQRVLGALVGLPEGEGYSWRLLDLVKSALANVTQARPGSMEDDWVLSCRRAVDDLRARGDDERAHDFLDELRMATRSTLHPLRRALQSQPGGSWPPPPGQGQEPLVEPFDRRLSAP
jgi:hypothetical protein